MNTFEGPPLDSVPDVGSLTLGAFLVEVGKRFADNEALVFDDPLRGGATVRWSYADLLTRARTVGRALIASGVGHGDAVGVLMGNRPEAVAALFGAAMAGAIAVPLSTFAPPPELQFMLERADVTVVLTQDRLLSRHFAHDLAELRLRLPLLREVVVVGTGTGTGTGQMDLTGWADFLDRARRVDDTTLDGRIASVRPDDEALVIFSSGTTSTPKAILHGHRSPTLQFWLQARIFGRHEQTRMWSALPLFWTAGLNSALGAALAAGSCFVMQEVFEPNEALVLISRERVTEPYSLPHQTTAMAECPTWDTTDLSSLRCVFGKSAFARHPSVQGDTGWMMPVGYGLSETCAFFAAHGFDTPRELMKHSIGRLLPGNQLRIVDPDSGRPLGVGEDGELAVKGPSLMLRYLGQSTEQCFDADGFFHTGDIGHVDADGFVHFSGRRSEMIKTGGANVSPAELEVQLRACGPVKLARVIGMPDARLEQIVVACVTLKDGASLTEADLQDFLRERVAAYKVPRRVLFFDDGEIPMTGSDTKVRDEALAALVADRLAATPPPMMTIGDR